MTTTAQAGASAPAAGRRVTPTGRLMLHHTAERDVWLNARRRGIGSSDLPAVMNLSGFKTPLHVFHDKRGRLPHDDDWSEAAHFGVLFEDPLARDWARRNRTVVEPVGLIANEAEAWQMCTLDRLCTECPLDRSVRSLCALEVKTRNAFVANLWRQGPPDDVLAQVLWQILVTGLDHVHVVCLIGGQDYRQYTVRRDEHVKLVAYLNAEAGRLWHDHIVPGRAPAPTGLEPPEALISLYDRLHPDREGVAVLDRDMDARDAMTEYLEGVALERDGKRQKAAAKAKLLAALGGAQAAHIQDRPFFSIEQSHKKTPDLARLAEEFPEAYRACVEDKPHDRISIPKYVREEYAA
ncbi:YqaJ viral recombinase family nuclease [Streptomyces wuyuanensis]|uniref:Putative phage-type endonuclease n=1 Tax=Streptomyces wuyuanensis TaxID=1196353 RepID=A0A1G9VWT8_9ACTN|nr:YqaJ viral recombinase family protein [Streptomyces wuyuanensis]SDM76411.1 putative phage-type endonuclease [Streptomyces wuyuanensis]